MPVSKTRKKVKQKQVVLTESKLNKLRYECTQDAVQAAFAIFYHALRDEFDFSIADLRRLQIKVNAVSEAVSDGTINVADIRDVLKQEDGILITK